MSIQKLLRGMESRAMDQNFFEGIYAFYNEAECAGSLERFEEEYSRNLPLLLDQLNPQETTLFEEAVDLYEKRREYVAAFAFKRGLFGGFRQFFSAAPDKDGGFTKFILNDLMVNPKNKKYSEYANYTSRCLEIQNQIQELFPEDDHDEDSHTEPVFNCCTVVFSIMDQREYSAAIDGFYCGYTAAYRCIEHINPIYKIENIDKILATEFYLGFIKPYRDMSE